MIKGIKIARNKDLKTFLFAENQVTVADSGDASQIFIHKMETVTSKTDQKFQKSKRKQLILKKEIR